MFLDFWTDFYFFFGLTLFTCALVLNVSEVCENNVKCQNINFAGNQKNNLFLSDGDFEKVDKRRAQSEHQSPPMLVVI